MRVRASAKRESGGEQLGFYLGQKKGWLLVAASLGGGGFHSPTHTPTCFIQKGLAESRLHCNKLVTAVE